MNISVEQAVNVLREELENDQGYRLGWQSNIACSVMDASKTITHEEANIAADKFIGLLCALGNPSTRAIPDGEAIVAKKVEVRWFDGYKETFDCTEVRAGNAYLWMRLHDGKNRWIPTQQVRWFSID